ncbi:hypothetical protein DBR42_00740 [Pelomonas sp. HMWF004]|nr:hypothetical protein DBR42_00740 [Pelomonas sp. HMWF004]
MSEHHPHEPQQTPPAQPVGVAARSMSKSRRSLLRAGMIGGPALVALKPAQVIACTCKLPSGFTVSGNASRGLKNCADPARKASVWRSTTNCKTAAPNYYYSGTATFTVAKGTKVTDLGFLTGGYTGTTVDQWLTAGDSSDQGLIMACYLEGIASGNNSTFPTKDKFVAMWNQGVVGTGYTPPNQTVAWTKAKVIAYLKFLTNQTV